MIRYQSVDDFPGWEKAPAFLKSVIEKYGSRSILEVGSGANPSLEPDYVRAQALNYVTSDLEESELAKAAPCRMRLWCSISVLRLILISTDRSIAFSRAWWESIL